MGDHVTIYEVGPRDGLQNEKTLIATEDKIRLVNDLTACGFQKIEVTSFVSPKWVPQMADATEVLEGIDRAAGVTYAALTPNLKGFDRARHARADEVAIFAAATEGFSKANINCTIDESLARFEPVVKAAQDAGISVRGCVSVITDCPYDGPVDPVTVVRVAKALAEMGCHEVGLADTIGAATPEKIAIVLDAVLQELPADLLSGHFHDTNGRALDNIEVSLQKGIRLFDSAIGGLGGCPYAPGATGNVATEAVVERVTELGYDTGLDAHKLRDVAVFARGLRGVKMDRYETLALARDARGVLNITLNRPDKKNALSGQMIADLTHIAEVIEKDKDIRVAVLRGAGDVFCAGGDLGWMRQQIEADREGRMREAGKLAHMLRALNELRVPLIGVLHGGAFGGGVGMACVCDIALAEDHTNFGLTETRLGLIPATISPYVIARMGEGKARQVFMSARIFSAQDAMALNLIAAHLPKDDLEARVEAEVTPYLSVAPEAVAASKSLARLLGPRIDDQVIEETITRLCDTWEGDEAKEGIDAFLTKRKPRWA